MTDDMKRVLEKAIEHYGRNNQMLKTYEEVGEFLQAMCKYSIDREKHRKRTEVMTDGVPTYVCGICEHRENYSHLQEEIADCIIMFEQMRLMFDPHEIDWWINFKLERLENRIDKEKKSV